MTLDSKFWMAENAKICYEYCFSTIIRLRCRLTTGWIMIINPINSFEVTQPTVSHKQNRLKLGFPQFLSCIGLLIGQKLQKMLLVLNMLCFQNQVHAKLSAPFFHQYLNQQRFNCRRQLNENVCSTPICW